MLKNNMFLHLYGNFGKFFSLDFLLQSTMNFATQVSMLLTFSLFDPRLYILISMLLDQRFIVKGE